MEDQLSSIGKISTKKMFGGHGVFHDGTMFGIIDPKGQAYLKADDALKTVFEKEGAKKHGRMPYYSIPTDVLEDKKKLVSWAKKSIAL